MKIFFCRIAPQRNSAFASWTLLTRIAATFCLVVAYSLHFSTTAEAKRLGKSNKSSAYLIIEREYNGTWYIATGQKRTVWVSQRIYLRARMSDGSALTNRTWDVPGNVFYNYIQTSNPTHPEPVSSLHEEAVYFIWRDRGENLNVNFTGIAKGKSYNRGVNFRVRKPQFTMTAQINVMNTIANEGLQLGNRSISIPPAQSAKVNVPPRGIVIMALGSGERPIGNVQFTQVATQFDVRQLNSTLLHGRRLTINEGLDGSPEYPHTLLILGAEYAMVDYPTSGNYYNTAQIRFNFGFTTWLMFKTNDAHSQWVSLRRMNWRGGGRANGTPPGPWTASDEYSSFSPSEETTVFPEWDQKLDMMDWTNF